MSQNTALQELKQWVDDTYPNFNKADIETKIDELFLKERQDIIDAWDSSTAATSSDDTGEQYFTQTYNQK